MSLYDDLMEKLDGREYGHYFSALCAFHDDSNPSMFVYQDGYFRCAACGKHGSHAYLAKRLSMQVPLTRSQPSRVLPQWRRWEEKYGDLEGIARFAHESLKRSPKNWIKERKIENFVESGRLGFLDGWITFPLVDDGLRVIDIVVRAIKGKGDTRYVVHPVSGDVSSRPLYIPNWQRVKEARTVYVVFGIIDAISLELLGLPVVTGITGQSVPVDRLRELNKRLIFLPDLGEEESAHKIANAYGMGARVRKLLYPEKTKDCDEVRRLYGNDFLMNMIGV